MSRNITWNGVPSSQYGIEVTKYPEYVKPQRKLDRYQVPGRNGDIIMMQDAWENVEQSYEIAIGDGTADSVPDSAGDLAEWLCSPKGYRELSDDFDTDHYRIAFFEGRFDVDPVSTGKVGRTRITFNCKPQRYLVSGKTAVTISSSPGSITNSTAYASKPLLFVQRSASGNGTITIGSTVFTITGIPSGGIYIDCESMECYDRNNNNCNDKVESNTSEFATLNPGANTIGFTGKVSSVRITPRWFEI